MERLPLQDTFQSIDREGKDAVHAAVSVLRPRSCIFHGGMMEDTHLENNKAPVLSIVIPVLNEQERINGCIARIRNIDRERSAEIIVVDGDPRGGTLAAVADQGVRCMVAGQGRASQMNCGARAAQGAFLLFLHADTLLPENAVALVVAALTCETVAAGAFDLGFNTERFLFTITEWYVFFRTRMTRIPFGDQGIFIRRSFFEELGGFRDIPIMEDVDLMKRIRRRGRRISIIRRKVLTSPRRYESEGILSCTARNGMLQLLYAIGVGPERLAKWYRPQDRSVTVRSR